MLTLLREIFTWWNRQTLGTRILTLLTGKFIGEDEFGNKYYQNKNKKRWVIYKNEIDASKIPVEWYSWIHNTKNKIENNHKFTKYHWQLPHQSNKTGTKNRYHPKNNKNAVKKKYSTWKD